MSLREFLAQFRTWRLRLLVASVVALAFVHQLAGVQSSRFHQVLDVLPYVSILLGALWFGLWGSLTCAALTATCYTAHLVLQESGGLLDVHFHRTLNILVFLVVGAFTGFIAQRQLRTFGAQRELAERLDHSYRELREKTEQVLAVEEQVQRANRLAVLGELAAGLAHEIGNPLGGIKGAAEILAERVPPGDETARFAALLLREVDRLDGVVTRFLDGVRAPPRGDGTADLAHVLEPVLSLTEPLLEKGRLELTIDLADGVPEVDVEPQQLHQVLLNLLLNAIQATPLGGRISVATRVVNAHVECDVRDTGRGIEPADLPRLFDPFFSRRAGGIGLGLSIAQRIVAAGGGEIRVASAVGAGSTFTVRLPCTQTAGGKR